MELNGFWLQFHPSRWAWLLHRLGLRRIDIGGEGRRLEGNVPPPDEIEAFGGAYWHGGAKLETIQRVEPHLTRMRLTLQLRSGGVVCGQWQPRVHSIELPDPVSLQQPWGQHLTFDDIAD
ncbi:hypothetical protein [Streptomyces sp. NPDC048473]|uniref:hypothetical protein n=1 Tax=unclassified Streptomyces TaxID=2593676 RepID=UPI003723837B